MEETRITRHGQTQWTTADKIAAYAHWKETASLAKTALALKIPPATLEKWCRLDGWVARREREDALEREMALQQAFVKVVRKVDPLIDALLQVAMTGDKEQNVQLAAIKHALGIIGISPIERKVVTTGRPADADERGMSERDRQAIEAILSSKEEDDT